MKEEINTAVKSKINWTVLVQSGMNMLIYFGADQGIIPADAVVDALVIGNMLAASLIAVFRTWFTKP